MSLMSSFFSRGNSGRKAGQGSRLTSILLVLAFLSALSLTSRSVRADEDDEDSASSAHASAEKMRRHSYLGGRDEEDLTVQTSVPQPARSPDAVAGAASGGDSDSTHD